MLLNEKVYERHFAINALEDGTILVLLDREMLAISLSFLLVLSYPSLPFLFFPFLHFCRSNGGGVLPRFCGD